MPDGWRKAGGIFKVDYRVPDGASKTATLTYITLGNSANVLCTGAYYRFVSHRFIGLSLCAYY